MKNHVLILLIAISSSFKLQAQEDASDFTTYFAEKAQFTIDLPDKWSTGLVEEKNPLIGYSTNITSFDAQEEGTLFVLMSMMGCKSANSKAKSYKKIFEKSAKKSSDIAFRIIEEGQQEDQFGKNYNWIDFVHTLELDDGRKIVLRELFYVRCHNTFNAKYANTFRFQTNEKNWEKNVPLFKEIYSTVKFLKKNDM